MSSDHSHPERRVSYRLLEYWENCKQAENLPPVSVLSPLELKDIWDDCFIILFSGDDDDNCDVTFEYTGPNVIAAYGNLREEEFSSAMVKAHSGNILAKAMEVIQTRQPVHDQSVFTNTQEQLVKYRLSMVPFTDSEGSVTHIVGGMRWCGAEIAIDLC